MFACSNASFCHYLYWLPLPTRSMREAADKQKQLQVLRVRFAVLDAPRHHTGARQAVPRFGQKRPQASRATPARAQGLDQGIVLFQRLHSPSLIMQALALFCHNLCIDSMHHASALFIHLILLLAKKIYKIFFLDLRKDIRIQRGNEERARHFGRRHR